MSDCSFGVFISVCLLSQPKLPPDVGAESRGSRQQLSRFFLFSVFINANILINVLLMESIYLRCDTVQRFELFFSFANARSEREDKNLKFKKKKRRKKCICFHRWKITCAIGLERGSCPLSETSTCCSVRFRP